MSNNSDVWVEQNAIEDTQCDICNFIIYKDEKCYTKNNECSCYDCYIEMEEQIDNTGEEIS